jgi:agmatine deiminase
MPKLKILNHPPAALGYSFPAEWEPHTGTWFSWPRPEGISFPGKHHTVPAVMAAIFREIAPREMVHVNVPNENVEQIVRTQLKEAGGPTKNIVFHHIRTNENWCRDHGPAFVVNRKTKKLAVVDWGFNAWGGKYPPYDADDRVPTEIATEFGLPIFYPKTKTTFVVMEGGAIEQYLKDYYGQQKICWLTGGIEGDDTDGHVDDLARFIAPGKIVIGVEEDPKDVNYKVLQSAKKQVEKLTDQDGRPFEIIEIPMPGVVECDSQRLPATYVNFYFVNGALLVPTYRNRKNDRKAIEILQSHLPKLRVIGIDCVELIWGLGAIHCLTQQQPRV